MLQLRLIENSFFVPTQRLLCFARALCGPQIRILDNNIFVTLSWLFMSDLKLDSLLTSVSVLPSTTIQQHRQRQKMSIPTPPASVLAKYNGTNAVSKNGLGLLGRLPLEIRHKIYELCLTANVGTTMRVRGNMTKIILESQERSTSDLLAETALMDVSPQVYEQVASRKQGKTQFPFADTTLLNVSRQINMEATPVFYGSNTFHYQIRCKGKCDCLAMFSWSPSFMKNLSHMRHISIGYQEGVRDFHRRHYNPISEILLPRYLRMIQSRCIDIRSRFLLSLDIILVSKLVNICADENLDHNNFLGMGPTATALLEMKSKIEKLTIVGIGQSEPVNVHALFCSQIAPLQEWSKQCSGAWRFANLEYCWHYKGKMTCILPMGNTPYDRSRDGSIHCWRSSTGGLSRTNQESEG